MLERELKMSSAKQNALRDTVEIIKAHGSSPNFNYSRISQNIRETYESLLALYCDAEDEQ
jgi:hypothetical protein